MPSYWNQHTKRPKQQMNLQGEGRSVALYGVNNGSDFDALIPLKGQMFKSISMNTVQIMRWRLSAQIKVAACGTIGIKRRMQCVVSNKHKENQMALKFAAGKRRRAARENEIAIWVVPKKTAIVWEMLCLSYYIKSSLFFHLHWHSCILITLNISVFSQMQASQLQKIHNKTNVKNATIMVKGLMYDKLTDYRVDADSISQTNLSDRDF